MRKQKKTAAGTGDLAKEMGDFTTQWNKDPDHKHERVAEMLANNIGMDGKFDKFEICQLQSKMRLHFTIASIVFMIQFITNEKVDNGCMPFQEHNLEASEERSK